MGGLWQAFLRLINYDKVAYTTVEPFTRHKTLITVGYQSGHEEQYVGDGTVWLTYPDYGRTSQADQAWLYRIWTRDRDRQERAPS